MGEGDERRTEEEPAGPEPNGGRRRRVGFSGNDNNNNNNNNNDNDNHRRVIPCNGDRDVLEEETESNLARSRFRSSSCSRSCSRSGGNSDAGSGSGSSASISTATATSSISITTTTTTTNIPIPSLHQSLLRNHKKKDPFRYYDTLNVLGDGSMGSVSLVKKRHSCVGGSARRAFVERERRSFAGGLFGVCGGGGSGSGGIVWCGSGSGNSNTNTSTSTLCGFAKKVLLHLPCLSFCPGAGAEETKEHALTTTTTTTAAELAAADLRESSKSFGSIPPDELPGYCILGNTDGDVNGDVNAEGTDRKSTDPKPVSPHHHSTLVSFQKDYGVEYALKSIVLDKNNNNNNTTFVRELRNEIAILKSVDHPNICKAIETYEFQNRVYLVLELCSGGDLYTRDPYTERRARHIVRSILDACAYLHRKKITHRDLKYENIMFASPTSPTVKIIDFGLSKQQRPEHGTKSTGMMKNIVGTVYTMAPEVVLGHHYDRSCDVWSIGVVAFMLLSSSLPFYGPTRDVILRKITTGNFAFRGPRWRDVSGGAKNLVRSLLTKDPRARPSCVRALEHDWFSGSQQPSSGGDDGEEEEGKGNEIEHDASVLDRVLATIQTFAGYSRLKKLALYVIAHKSTSDEIGFLQQLFTDRFDATRDGVVTLAEFREALGDAYYYCSHTDTDTDTDVHTDAHTDDGNGEHENENDELAAIFAGMDIDGTGIVSYNEFLAATIEAHGCIEESRIAEAFDRLDSDDNGYITVSNLTEFLGPNIGRDYIESIINLDDVDAAGVDAAKTKRIDYETFLGLWDGNYDEVLEANLRSVRKKRLARERGSAVPALAQPRRSDGGNDNYNDASDTARLLATNEDSQPPAAEALGPAPMDSGKFYFEKEKEMSMRGEWV